MGKNSGRAKDVARGRSQTPRKSPKPPRRDLPKPAMKSTPGKGGGNVKFHPLVTTQTFGFNPDLPIVPARVKARSPSTTLKSSTPPEAPGSASPGPDRTWTFVSSPAPGSPLHSVWQSSSAWFTVSTPVSKAAPSASASSPASAGKRSKTTSASPSASAKGPAKGPAQDKGNAIIAQWARWVAGAYSFVVGANASSKL